MGTTRFKTGSVSRRLGIESALLRTWEARYQLVTPSRGPGGQRLYSEEDVAVLHAVQTLIGRGHSVGEVASWSRSELVGMATEAPTTMGDDIAFERAAHVSPLQATLSLEREGTIAIASPSIQDVLGWSHGLLVGQPIWGFLLDVTPELERALLGSLRGHTLKTQATLRSATGAAVRCELACGAGRRSGGGTRVTVAIHAVDRSDGLFSAARQQAIKAALRLASRPSLDVLREVALRTVEQQTASLSRVWTYDARKGVLRLVASAGGSTGLANSSRAVIRLATYPFKVGLAARSQIPYVHNGLEGDRDFDVDWVRREKLESAAVFPIVERGRLLGVTASFFRRTLTGVDLAELQVSLDACRMVLGEQALA
jgi:DNA-binding transcriptional MerR regulator